MTFKAEGVWTALATPFDASGALDNEALKRLVAFQTANGVTGVLPCGTTGESPTLSWQEHDAVIDQVIAHVDGKVGVLAGTGSNNTAEAIRSTEHARAVGADAALLVDCYYNGPSSLELRTEYYERILDKVADIPVVPYVIPGRSGCALGAADLAMLHLADPARVPAVKQATGDLARMRQDRALAGPGLAIMSGDDELTLQMMRDPEIGCAGAVSVMSNLVPRALSKMVRYQGEGRTEDAQKIADVISPLLGLVGCPTEATRSLPNGQTVTVIDKYRNPVPLKTMMAALGMLPPHVRPPLGWMAADAVAQCRQALTDVHANDPSVFRPIAEHFEVDIYGRLADHSVWNTVTR